MSTVAYNVVQNSLESNWHYIMLAGIVCKAAVWCINVVNRTTTWSYVDYKVKGILHSNLINFDISKYGIYNNSFKITDKVGLVIPITLCCYITTVITLLSVMKEISSANSLWWTQEMNWSRTCSVFFLVVIISLFFFQYGNSQMYDTSTQYLILLLLSTFIDATKKNLILDALIPSQLHITLLYHINVDGGIWIDATGNEKFEIVNALLLYIF